MSLGQPGRGAGTLRPGERVTDRYTVTRYLGGGGMGDVYEVVDLELQHRVALKIVRAGVASDETMRLRFHTEIQLARRVTHPNVCRVFDLGSHGELTYLTMELLAPGETLAERVETRGRIDAAAATLLVGQLAAGLAAAHAAGVVHRDFKSANVMLVPDARAPGGCGR